jgi:ankyrin repeat protein
MQTRFLAPLALLVQLSVVLTGCITVRPTPPLIEATRDGDVARMTQLLDAGAGVNGDKDGGSTPLDIAATFGNLEGARLLVWRGADVNLKSNDWPPLFSAINQGHFDVAKFLIEKGANVKATTGNNETALHVVAGTFDRLQWTFRNRVPSEGMESYLKTAELLIGKGVNVNARTAEFPKPNFLGQVPRINKMTPLHYAAKFNRPELATLLIAHGAEINAIAIGMINKYREGNYTPLDVAIEAKSDATAEVLLKAGGKTELKK